MLSKAKLLAMRILGGGGASVNLDQLTATWQAGGTGHAAGMYTASFSHQDSGAPNNGQWLSLMDTYSLNRVRQDGTITAVTYKAFQVGGTGGKFKLKVYRKNGAVYNFVGESEEISVTTTAVTTRTLTNPIAVLQGDCIGEAIFKPSSTNFAYMDAAAKTGSLVKYVFDADVSTDNAWSSGISWSLCLDCFVSRPAVAVTGDSIGEGFGTPNWLSLYEGEVSSFTGTKTSQPAAKLAGLITDLQYQNHALQSMKWDWVRSTGIVSALTCNPKWVIIQCGTNEVFGGRSWATIQADMDAVKVLADAAGAKLIISEVPPLTGSSDANAALIRTYNTNYAAWCTANGATLARIHDEVGKLRVSTGYYDDWADAYNSGDNTHPSDAGKAAIAAQWKLALARAG